MRIKIVAPLLDNKMLDSDYKLNTNSVSVLKCSVLLDKKCGKSNIDNA